MMDDPERPTRWPAIAVAGAVIIAAGGAWFYFHSHRGPVPAPTTVPSSAPPAKEEAIKHPLPPGAAGAHGPLPPLRDSDAPLHEALSAAIGPAAVKDYVVTQDLVRHLVVTIDNLPRQKIAVDKRPLLPVAGSFIASGDEEHAMLDERNFARYRPMVAVIGGLDVEKLVSVYLQYYPLFQQAYQDLGYPNGYFNDRLVQAIDSVLAAPDLKGGVALVRPNVMYSFADPALEERPAGQKLLMRMGAQNAAVIKAKLRELRAALTTATPPH